MRASIGADYFYLATTDADILTSAGELPYDQLLNEPDEAAVMTHEDAIGATVALVRHKEIDEETQFVEPVLLADAVREEQEISDFRKTCQPAVNAEIACRGELHNGACAISVVAVDPRSRRWSLGCKAFIEGPGCSRPKRATGVPRIASSLAAPIFPTENGRHAGDAASRCSYSCN